MWVQSTNRARRFTTTTQRRWGHEHGLEVKPPRFISATSRPDPSPGQELHIESPVFAGPAPSLSRLCRVTGKLPPASVGICGRPIIPARFSCKRYLECSPALELGRKRTLPPGNNFKPEVWHKNNKALIKAGNLQGLLGYSMCKPFRFTSAIIKIEEKIC